MALVGLEYFVLSSGFRDELLRHEATGCLVNTRANAVVEQMYERVIAGFVISSVVLLFVLRTEPVGDCIDRSSKKDESTGFFFLSLHTKRGT